MIKLFYHIYTSSHRVLGMSFIDQQLRRIYVSQINKFAELNCVIVGPYADDAEDMITRYGGWNIREKHYQDLEQLGETRTLKQAWLRSQPDDAIVYMHTKGIRYASGERTVNAYSLPRNLSAINSWRWAMEHYTIDRWVERFNHLRTTTSDVQGAFLNFTPYMNYVGNFWWSKGSHIRRLCDPTTMQGITHKDAARHWLFWHMPTYTCDFHILDRPRDDGVYVYGAFRLHEDDCLPYVLAQQNRLAWPPLGPQHLV